MTAELEIERRFEAFARSRLSPTAQATARMRARVMREARLAIAAQTQTLPAVTSIERHSVRRRTVARRGVGLLLAAGLATGMAGGAMAASQAGGLLYPTRIWLETLTLPSDSGNRADAEIKRMNDRLAEVAAAAARGDRQAVAAALAAYQQIADQAFVDALGDTAATERLQVALDRHVAVLQAVAEKVPPQASEAIETNIQRAIDHNDAAVENSKSNPSGPTGPTGPSGPNSPAASNPPRATPDAKPEKSAKPEPVETPVPQATPDAQPTPRVDPPKGPPSEKPDKTPRGGQGARPTP